MEARCDTFIEHLNGEHEIINTAFLILVALDENERPTTIPKLILNTKEELFLGKMIKEGNKKDATAIIRASIIKIIFLVD